MSQVAKNRRVSLAGQHDHWGEAHSQGDDRHTDSKPDRGDSRVDMHCDAGWVKNMSSAPSGLSLLVLPRSTVNRQVTL